MEGSNGDSRFTTLSITSFGPCTLENQKNTLGRYEVKKINDISDIDGAKSQSRYEKFANKPPFQQSEVFGSTSKPLTHERNTRDNSLYIDDIPGTRYMQKDRMLMSQRHINPLQPTYTLPSFVAAEPDIPKFHRDELDHSDIEKSTSRPLYKKSMRDTYSIGDIEGASANWKPRNERARREAPPNDIMKVQDIAAKNRYTDKTTRSNDPLNPVYAVNGSIVADDPRFTKPKHPKDFIPENHQLLTRDIAGATVGWRRQAFERREWRNTNNTLDIKGAQADTFKHSIITKRETHPLAPVYQSLDPGEVLPPVIAPLIPETLVFTPTIRPPKGGNQTNGRPMTDTKRAQTTIGIYPQIPIQAKSDYQFDFSSSNIPPTSFTKPENKQQFEDFQFNMVPPNFQQTAEKQQQFGDFQFNMPPPSLQQTAEKKQQFGDFQFNMPPPSFQPMGEFQFPANNSATSYADKFSVEASFLDPPKVGSKDVFGSDYQTPIFAADSSGQQASSSKPLFPNEFNLDFLGFTAPNTKPSSGSARDKGHPIYDSKKKPLGSSASPAISARNSGRRDVGMTAAERRDAKERQDEINAVRSL